MYFKNAKRIVIKLGSSTIVDKNNNFKSQWLKSLIADIKKLRKENKDIVIALNAIGANVGFVEIESDKGHDSFLLNVPNFLKTLKNFLDKSYAEKHS